MRRLLCTFTLAALLAASAPVESSLLEGDSVVVREVQGRFDALVEAAKTLDISLYMSFFDPDKFSGLRPDGRVYHSLSEFEQEYRAQVSAIEGYESLEFSRVKISAIDSATAVLVNEYRATVRLTDGDVASGAGAGTQVWSKASGRWLLVSVSSSSASE